MEFLKKISLRMAAFLLLSVVAWNSSAKGGNAPAFDKGDRTIGVFLGAGLDYDYAYGHFEDADRTFMPTIGVYYDQGIFSNVGPGTIGIGGLIAYKADHRKYAGNTYDYNTLLVAARATYHLALLKDKNNKFDPYGGVTVGIRSSHFKDSYDSHTHSSVDPIAGLFVGAKYNFQPGFGAFAEVGYDISLVRLGLNINF
ncbi:MAG: outer membrane beta-barrel protein [Bacteroidetes bacterium]|nr:outer membrane beta-barrel protein [Bacteroidota bacterium]